MVSVLDSGSSGPGLSAGRGHSVCSWATHFNSHSASLQPGVSMGSGDKMLGGNLQWTSIPSRGSSNAPSRLHVTGLAVWVSLARVWCYILPVEPHQALKRFYLVTFADSVCVLCQ